MKKINMAKYMFVIAGSIFLSPKGVFASEYNVQPGNTLYSISVSTKVSVDSIKAANHLTSNTVYVGQVLIIPDGTTVIDETPVATPTASTYTVKAGDTLYSISVKTKVSVDQLKTFNKLSSNSIYVGQVLKLSTATTTPQQPSPAPTPVTTTPDPTPMTTQPLPAPTTASTYTVKSGDTLYRISVATKVSVETLKTLNNLTSNTLYIGQVLKLNDAPLPAVTVNVDKLIADAKALMGVPYLWGGTTPSGFDCSGFVQYVYAQQGIKLPRVAQDQWNAGKVVTTPQVGDLVFFTTYQAGPSHNGIYIGNNEFIHSGSSTGVTIASLSNSYWKPLFLGYRSFQ